MAYLKFLDSKNVLKCTVLPSTEGNIVTLKFENAVVVDTSGFNVYLDEEQTVDIGGNSYLGFTTIYRNDEETAKYNGYQLSNDGSVYVKPIYTTAFTASEGGELIGIAEQKAESYNELIIPMPQADENYKFREWVPEIPSEGEIDSDKTFRAVFEYVPTLEEIQEQKIVEMNEIQQSAIQGGFDVSLIDGTVEHFTLTDHDQTSLMGLRTRVDAGDEFIPWHDSDQSTGCKYYSNADMGIITNAALAFVAWHVTYFINLRIYIRALHTKEEVEQISYGVYIPEEYQDEVMRDLYANVHYNFTAMVSSMELL